MKLSPLPNSLQFYPSSRKIFTSNMEKIICSYRRYPGNKGEYSSTFCLQHLGLYSPATLQNIFSFVLQIFQYLAAFECNTTSDWLSHMVKPIRSCVTFKCTKSWRKRQRMCLRMVREYGPGKGTFRHLHKLSPQNSLRSSMEANPRQQFTTILDFVLKQTC